MCIRTRAFVFVPLFAYVRVSHCLFWVGFCPVRLRPGGILQLLFSVEAAVSSIDNCCPLQDTSDKTNKLFVMQRSPHQSPLLYKRNSGVNVQAVWCVSIFSSHLLLTLSPKISQIFRHGTNTLLPRTLPHFHRNIKTLMDVNRC